MTKVAIIDCGVGNLFSITCALRKTGLKAGIVTGSKGLKDADAIVLPGVGNFKVGSRSIQTKKNEISELVESGVPLFCICLGMQLLFESSEESPGKGIGLLKGKNMRLPLTVKIPHMGWNTLEVIRPNDVLNGICEDDYFYFVHSYYSNPVDRDVVVAETDYGINLASVVACGNVWGTQFHPEKSGRSGEIILRNFAKIIKK